MTRTSRVVGGTIAGALHILIAIALQIVLMPLILRVAGQETLGVYAILLQIIGYLAVMDFGIATALNRSMSQAIHDRDRFQALLNAGFAFLFIVGIAYALIGTGVAFALPSLFHLSGPLASESQMAMLLLAGWGVLRFPLGVFANALTAIQDLGAPPLLIAASNILRMIVAVLAVQAGQGIIGLSAASVIAEALLAAALMARFLKLHPDMRLQFQRSNWQVLREQVPFGLRAFWGNLAGRVVFSTDNIIVGNLYGAAVTSVYYNTQTPIFVAYNVVFRLADNAAPGVNELWAKKEWQKLRDIFLRLQRLTLLMVVPIVIGGWFYLKATIEIWVGAVQFGGQWLTLWLVLFAALTTARFVPQVFLYASGNLQRFSQIVTFEAIINVALSFFLGAMLGPHGVALATLSAHLPTAIYLQTRVHRDLEIPWRGWAGQTIAPAFFAAIPTMIVAAALSSLFPPTSWASLALHASIIGLIHLASSYLFGFSVADRTVVQRLIRR